MAGRFEDGSSANAITGTGRIVDTSKPCSERTIFGLVCVDQLIHKLKFNKRRGWSVIELDFQ